MPSNSTTRNPFQNNKLPYGCFRPGVACHSSHWQVRDLRRLQRCCPHQVISYHSCHLRIWNYDWKPNGNYPTVTMAFGRDNATLCIDVGCQVIGSMRGRELQDEATLFLHDVWCKGATQNDETCHILRHHCVLGSTADHKCLEAWCAVLAAAATSGGMAESCFFSFRMCSKTGGSRWATVPKAPN